jgi:hypothetical protein
MRPGGIVNPGVGATVMGALFPPFVVKLNVLAAFMIDVGIAGGEEKTFENGEIVKKGTALLK